MRLVRGSPLAARPSCRELPSSAPCWPPCTCLPCNLFQRDVCMKVPTAAPPHDPALRLVPCMLCALRCLLLVLCPCWPSAKRSQPLSACSSRLQNRHQRLPAVCHGLLQGTGAGEPCFAAGGQACWRARCLAFLYNFTFSPGMCCMPGLAQQLVQRPFKSANLHGADADLSNCRWGSAPAAASARRRRGLPARGCLEG